MDKREEELKEKFKIQLAKDVEAIKIQIKIDEIAEKQVEKIKHARWEMERIKKEERFEKYIKEVQLTYTDNGNSCWNCENRNQENFPDIIRCELEYVRCEGWDIGGEVVICNRHKVVLCRYSRSKPKLYNNNSFI